MMLAVLAAAACLPATGHAQRLVTVDAPSTHSTTAMVRVWRRDGSCWRALAGPWNAHVGRNGLAAHRHEGDGTTPLGTFAIASVAYGVSPNPGTKLAYHRLVCGDWWDEDPSSPTYNRFQHVACRTTPPFGGASEALWLQKQAYAHFLVIEFNTTPIVPGRGSAMFIHDDMGRPTNGCVSLLPADLITLLRLLRPADSTRIAIRISSS